MTDQIKNLKATLDHYNDMYYMHDDPVVSDEEYDSIKSKYLALTGQSEFTEVPGGLNPDLGKVTHTHPIRSLEKVKTEEELRAAVKRLLPVIIQPKFDGLTVVGYPGTTTSAGRLVTRGDGNTGENITHTALKIEGINRVAKVDYTIRMEAYMPIDVFKSINKKREADGLEPFKNPRNAAAGMLRHKDASKVEGIDYFAYNIVGSIETEASQINTLAADKFKVAPTWLYEDEEDVVNFVKNFDRAALNYEIDGLVIKSNKPNSLAIYGETGHHPKNAVAYKFPSQGQWTKLLGVTWQVGRTGRITPVAELEPVDVNGSTITRATLHNIAVMKTLNLSRNCKVFVIKANDVIPAITESSDFNPLAQFKEPTNCPECETKIEKVNDQIFCPNLSCKAKTVARIAHLARRDVLDIEGLSEETAELLFKHNKVAHPLDIFNLTVADIENLPGFAKRKAEKLIDAIQARRSVEFKRFIIAAGIPNVGRTAAEDIAKRVGSYIGMNEDMLNDFNVIRSIPGIGAETVKNLSDYYDIFDELESYINPIDCQITTPKVSTDVKTFVITGTLDNPRQYYEGLIKLSGHKVSGSVSKKTDYVLVGESAGSKLDKAMDLGIKIIRTEEELRELL